MKTLKWFLLLIPSLLLGTRAGCQVITDRYFTYSHSVGDTFEIYTSHIGPIIPDKAYSTVYYLDADIESGITIREGIGNEHQNKALESNLFIGIGHRSCHHMRRRRDYLPPLIKHGVVLQSRSRRFRQGDKFYAFLTKELIPQIEQHYTTNGRRTLIGHSFGGLFTLWALLKDDHPFISYIALSPSLWKNWGNIFQYEQQYHHTHDTLNAYLYTSVGTREVLNLVRITTRRMNRILTNRHYISLIYQYQEHKGKTHHTQVPISVRYLMRNLPF